MCFCFLLVFFYGEICQSQPFVPLSLSLIIRDFYENKSESFDIFISASGKNGIKSVNDALRITKTEYPYKVKKVQHNQEIIKINQSAILLFESLEEYHDFYGRSVMNNEFPKQFYFLTYIHNWNNWIRKELLFPPRNGKTHAHIRLLHDTTFLLNGHKSSRLATFKFYEKDHCHRFEIVELNHFSNKARRWEKKEYFLEKFNNFNGCEFYIRVYVPSPPFVILYLNDKNEIVDHAGYGMKINEDISKALNYKFKLHFYDFLKAARAPNCDFEIRSSSLASIKFRNATFAFCVTEWLAFSEEVILISNSELYSPLEKLFIPFDAATWKWLALTLSIAFIVVFLLRFVPSHLRKFIIGSRVETPMFNIVSISFGGGLSIVPGRNFSRFLLISFLLFSLVMRTAYQGKQYEFMQKSLRKRNVQTVEEMSRRNYTMYFEEKSFDYFKTFDCFNGVEKKTLEVNKFRKIGYLQNLLADGTKRGALINSAGMDWLIRTQNGSGFHSLKSRVLGRFHSFIFDQNNLMFRAFNRKVVQLTESGLTGKYIRDLEPKKQIEVVRPVVFTLQHLGIGFQIWLLFLGVSLLCFGLEFVVKFFKPKERLRLFLGNLKQKFSTYMLNLLSK